MLYIVCWTVVKRR